MVSLTGGTATPAGSVAFSLCKVDAPGLCTTGGTSVGSTNLTGAAYPATVVSPTAYVTSVGRYCWRAVFSGDSANGIPGSSDSSASECFTVNPVTPTLATTAGPDINLGGTLSDSATLGGTATQPANPVINLTGTGGSRSRRHDHVQAVRAGQLHDAGLHLAHGDGERQRHLQHTEPAVQADRGRHLPLGRGVQRGSPNTNGTTHNAACADANEDVVVSTVPVHVEQRSDLAAERLGHRQRPRRQRRPGRHRVLRPVRIGGLHRRRAIYSDDGAACRRLPGDRLDVEHHRQGDSVGKLLLEGQLRQRQRGPAGYPGQL